MRTLRLAMAGTVILALLTGTAGAVFAQADAEDQTMTPVTGTQTSLLMVTYPADGHEGPIETYRGAQFKSAYDWSDPRLPSLLLSNANSNLHTTDSGQGFEFAQTLRLVGDDGDWVGTAYGYQGSGSSLDLQSYTGEGAYEGLSAMLACGDVVGENGLTTNECSGYIFESGLPPMPEPVEPPAE